MDYTLVTGVVDHYSTHTPVVDTAPRLIRDGGDKYLRIEPGKQYSVKCSSIAIEPAERLEDETPRIVTKFVSVFEGPEKRLNGTVIIPPCGKEEMELRFPFLIQEM